MAAQSVGSTNSLGVLVGFDGSEHAVRALHWSAIEALARGVPLTVVSAFTVPRLIAGDVPYDSDESLARRVAEEVVEKAREQLKDYPGDVSFHIDDGDAAGVLVARSREAEIAVVGARGRGGFVGRMLGSVSSALPAHANCPTVVVDQYYEPPQGEGQARYTRVDQRPVVVGIDQSKGSRLAALRAAEVAAALQVELRVVMAIAPIEGSLIWYPELGPREEEGERRRRQLEDQLEDDVQWLSKHFSTLTITPALYDGPSGEVLGEETDRSQLTVVGTRGRGGVARALLGSTSSDVIMHAAGPVMVVPAGEDPRLDE